MRELIGPWPALYDANLREMMRKKAPPCAHGGGGWYCYRPELKFSPWFRRLLRFLFPNRTTRPRCALDPVHGTDGRVQCLYHEPRP
jgi:hypothetical protein